MEKKEQVKKRINSIVCLLPIVLPIVFVLVFFGYFRVHYDIVLQVDNVKGEGICQTNGTKADGRTAANLATFYFGSELQKVTIKDAYYDVNELAMVISDVSEFDIVSVDSYVKGIHTGHLDAVDLLADGESVEGTSAKLTSENGVMHVEVYDPEEGTTVYIEDAFVPWWFWALYFAGIFLISLLLSALLEIIFRRFPALKLPLVSLVCIIIVLLVGSFFCGSLSFMTYEYFLLNCVILFAAAILLNALTLPFTGTLAVMVFTTIWYIANYFVITLRGKPIMPADLKALGTAEEVMGGYTFAPSWQMIVGVMVVIGYAVLLIWTWRIGRPQEKPPLRRRLLKRGVLILVAVLLMVGAVNSSAFQSLRNFAWDTVLMRSFHEEGMVLTYLKSVYNSRVEEPDGYSLEIVNSYLEEYESATAVDSEAVQPVNIIMVMNEAFSDLRAVGLDDSIDVMPFIDSLDADVMEGYLNVSIFGGGTCNTEFEALTGNTLAFLGAGAYPYTEYVTKPLFSLASYFRNAGFAAEAFHPNDPDNWNRSMAYPNLGFEKYNSIDDFKAFGHEEYLHDLPADLWDYRFMEAVSEQHQGNNRFLFDVTMQNHSPYDRWLDVEEAESVAENGSDLYFDAQVYLSLVKASDDEVKQLVETYRDSEEPTMIIFFGDHQPGLPATAINQIYTDVGYNIDLYKTKFFIWTNYDTEEQPDMQLSANFLPWLILERGNFSLPPYVQMLKEVHEKYPVISSQGVMDAEGNVYAGVAELMDDPLIKKYQCIQYANLFDEIDDRWFETE